MKRVTTLLVVLGGLTLGVADATSLPTESNVQVQERVQLMNEMKEKMMQMSPEERKVAIGKMQENMPKEMQENMQKQMRNGEGGDKNQGERKQMRQHANEMQMEHSNEMAQHQNMNQQQAGKQFQGEMKENMQGIPQSGQQGRNIDSGSINFGGAKGIQNH